MTTTVNLPGSCPGTATIVSQADVSSIASCNDVDAILLPSAASGSISIDGPTNIGDIICINNSVTSLSSSTFQFSGNLTIQDNLALHTLNFSQMGHVSTLTFNNLPSLKVLILSSSIDGSAVEVVNTAIESFPEVNFDDTGGTITFTNNTALNLFTFQGTFINSMQFQGNFAPNLSGINVSCPHLRTAETLDLFGCSDIYLPLLSSVSGFVSVENNWFSSFSAPSLTLVGKSLTLYSNPNLTIVELPKLETVINACEIWGNPMLSSLDLQALQSADLYITGNFSQLDLPVYISEDTVYIDSSGPFNCSSFVASVDAQASITNTTPGVIATPGVPDTWECVAQNVTYTAVATGTGVVSSTASITQAPSNSASTTPVPSSKTGLSTGAKIGIGLGVPLGLIFLSGLIFLVWKRRSAKENAHPWQVELPQGGHHEKSELKGEGNHPVEVPTEEQPGELVVNHPPVELA